MELFQAHFLNWKSTMKPLPQVTIQRRQNTDVLPQGKSLIDNIKELVFNNQGMREKKCTGRKTNTHKQKNKPFTFRRIFKNTHGSVKRPQSNFRIEIIT